MKKFSIFCLIFLGLLIFPLKHDVFSVGLSKEDLVRAELKPISPIDFEKMDKNGNIRKILPSVSLQNLTGEYIKVTYSIKGTGIGLSVDENIDETVIKPYYMHAISTSEYLDLNAKEYDYHSPESYYLYLEYTVEVLNTDEIGGETSSIDNSDEAIDEINTGETTSSLDELGEISSATNNSEVFGSDNSTEETTSEFGKVPHSINPTIPNE